MPEAAEEVGTHRLKKIWLEGYRAGGLLLPWTAQQQREKYGES